MNLSMPTLIALNAPKVSAGLVFANTISTSVRSMNASPTVMGFAQKVPWIMLLRMWCDAERCADKTEEEAYWVEVEENAMTGGARFREPDALKDEDNICLYI